MSKGTRAAGKGRRLVLAKGLRFSCRRCGDCCRDFPIGLTPAEVERYEARDWSEVLGYPAQVVRPVREGGTLVHYLARKVDGTCLFLAEDASCRMHAALGAEEKPLACRAYPFVFVAGDEGKRPLLGAHFACSSIAGGEGERVNGRRKELERLLAELVEIEPLPRPPEPIPFDATAKLSYSRGEVDLLLELATKELEDAGRPFPERMLAVAKFLSLVANSRFPALNTPTAKKAVTSFARGIGEQVRRNLLSAPVEPPSFPQRLLFRMLLAFAVRRDSAKLMSAGFLRRGVYRVGNLLRGLGFLVGSGRVLPVGRERTVSLGEVRRRAPAADPASPEADGALTRYFVAQLSGGLLHGGEFQVRQLLPALGLLLRQYPVVLLLARAACYARGGQTLAREDYASALRTADWSFGRVPWTSGFLGRLRARLLADLEASFAFLPWCSGQEAEEAGDA